MNLTKGLLIFGLAAATASFATKYEAENATLAGGAESKGAFVAMNGGSITFNNVNVSTAGKYSVTIHYAGSYGEKKNNLVVNGSTTSVAFNDGKSFEDVTVAVSLKAGNNTIAITKDWGWIDVDYIDVSEYASKTMALCNAPVTPNATENAVKLYNFLVNNFGSKTISGIMTGEMDSFKASDGFKTHPDVNAVYEASGKYPALVGVDFLFATGPNAGGSWQKDYTNKAVALAKDLWNNGGIPAFTWHWKDPDDNVDAFYANQNSAGYEDDGTPKPFTTFDFTKAFMTGTTTWDTLSKAYQGIINDIDSIADIFLKLQEDGVAAIFRPLHEAGGTWFWWSTHTGPQFAALYRLVYERMVFKKGVKNLVWVFNPENSTPTTWDPGTTYYDVLSIDIYNKANDHSSNAGAFDGYKDKWGVSKVLALSENGPIPDVENMHTDKAVWSWWMPWYQTWGGNYVSQTANSVWKSNMEDSRVITLDGMPGWNNYSGTNSGTATCEVAKETSTYNGDKEKANGEKKDDQMEVTLATLTSSGALINYTKLPDLSSAKSISVDFAVNGSGNADGGVWIGLAFVRDGSSDGAWTWEQSPSDGCWIEQNGGKKTCTFDITKYTDDAGTEHPIDFDNLFSVVFNFSAEGFSGKITVDNMVTDNGIIISSFDDAKGLFAVSDGYEKAVTSIKLASEGSAAIRTFAKFSASKLSIMGKNVMLTTATTGNVSVDIFAMNGRRIATLFQGNLFAGTYAFSLADMPKGNYIVRVKESGLTTTQPVIVK